MRARYVIPKRIKAHDGSERRAEPRAPLETDALVHSRGEKYLCRAVDISVSGASIRIESQDLLDRFVHLDLYLPDNFVWVDVQAEVVRAERNGESITWGLAFKSPDRWALGIIEEHVRGRMIPSFLPG